MEQQVALALYSVRDDFAADTHQTLKAVKEMGYSAVEFAGLAGKTAADIRAQLDDLGLRGLSAHVPIQRQQDDLAGVIREAKTLGLQYVVCPWLPPEQRNPAFYRELVPSLQKIGKACADEGLTYCYHNHDFELTDHIGDHNVLEFFAQAIEPQHLRFEIDVYWAKFVDLDPVELLKQFAGRVPLVHLKDMSVQNRQSFAEVGSGTLDMPGILKTAEAIGAQWSIVEQDHSQRGPLESAAISFKNLKALGMG